MNISFVTQWLPIIGRELIGLFYVFFAVWNIKHWQPTLTFMQEKHLPCATFLLGFGVTWQTAMGTLIIIGLWVSWAALLLMPFTVVSVCIFHAFWNFTGDSRRLNTLLFVTHLTSSLGALCLLSGVS